MENIRTVKAYEPQADRYAEPEDKQDDISVDDLTAERFRKIESWFYGEQQAQAENRWSMARAQDFIDGDQWTEEDKEELASRNQPAMVFNLMGTTIRWITGTEKRTRVDYSVVGRGKEDTDSAENKTALLKYLDDVNNGGYYRSKAFEDAVGAGLGWLDVGVHGDPGKEPLYERYESWRNVWHDRFSIEPDCADGRYIFRARWVDLDVAKKYFPEKAAELELAAEDHEYYYADDEFAVDSLDFESQSQALGVQADNHHNKRRRVRLVECWYREAEECDVVRSKNAANGAIVNDEDTLLASMADEVYQAIRQIMRLMIFVSGRENRTGQVLYDGKSPYWHNRFPLVPVWGYRRKRTNLPYGAAEGLIDPQIDLNKRKSKAQFILSTKGVIMDKGAVDDMDRLAEEIARPDYIIEKKVGAEFRVDSDRSLAAEHVNLMNQDAEYIQKVGGVTDENLGRQTNATSGKAIEARQDQGTTVNTDLFENLWIAMKVAGELKLSLIEQYYTEQKVVRLIGERGKIEFKDINGEGFLSIQETQADFIVDRQAFNQSVRRAMFEQLMAMVAKLPPEIALKLLDVVIEMSDIPERDEIVARIRQINGMRDKDAEPTPEEQAQIEAEQAAMQEKLDLEKRMANANVSLIEAKAGEAQGRAKDYESKAMMTALDAVLKKLTTFEAALAVAGLLQQNPTIGAGADQVIEDVTR